MRTSFRTEKRVIVRDCAMIPHVGDIIDIPLSEHSATAPMMAYRVTERRWLIPQKPSDIQVALKLEAHEAVHRSPYPDADRDVIRRETTV